MCLAVLAVVGCGQEPEYAFRYLELERYGWDSLSVEAQFGERLLFGRTRPTAPQATSVFLFNAAYDTLYAGDGRLVPIADRKLGDGERLMLEVCGRFETMTVCDQQTVAASPKRLRVEHDIVYPDGWAFEKGRYDFHFIPERQIDDGTWERIGQAGDVHGYLRAYVGKQTEEAVEVPITGNKGRFDLQGRPHFDEFQYQLTSALIEQGTAPVHFEVYAGLEGWPASLLASDEKKVRDKTEEERALEVEHFIEQATEMLFDALEIEEVDWMEQTDSTTWVFNQLTNTYRIKMALAWEVDEGRFFRRPRMYEVEGLLEVEAGGDNARFVRQAANGRTARRWADTVAGPTLALGPLEPYDYEEEEEE